MPPRAPFLIEPSNPKSLVTAPPRTEVPWRLGAVIASGLVVVTVGAVGTIGLSSVLSVLAPGYLKHNYVEFEIGDYQFLTLGVMACIVLIFIPRYRVSLSTLGFRVPGWKTFIAAGLAYIPIFLLVALAAALISKLFPGFLQSNAREVLQGNQRLTVFQEILLLIWSSIQAPLTEEVLFRGIMFQGIREFFARRMPYGWAVFGGAVVSGLVFGLAHAEPHTLPILVLLGIALAYVFQYTQSLYCSALVHGINNFLAVLTLFQSI
jgi:membrane protease YdiL (CAAX protease family)